MWICGQMMPGSAQCAHRMRKLSITSKYIGLQCKLRISIRSVEAISMLIDSYSYAKIKYYYVNCYKKTLTYAIDIA